MKIVTFRAKKPGEKPAANYQVGAWLAGQGIVDLTPLLSRASLSAPEVLEIFDLESGFLAQARAKLADVAEKVFINPDDVELAAPVPRPGKVICIGLNYRDHAAESGMAIPASPVIFSKFPTCVIGPQQAIARPVASEKVDYEAELAFVVGRRAKNVKRAEAMDYVFGYANFNDVSARDFQFADGQWQRGKSCDTFAPLGAWVTTADEIADPHNLRIRLRLNGATLQDSNTSQLIFGIPELIEFLSQAITLEPGDVIATGTPPGVGFARQPPVFMRHGDTVEVEIEGLGVLSNPLVNA